MPDAKTAPATSAAAPVKKHTAAAMQRELRDLAKPASDAQEKPPVDPEKTFLRVGLVLGVLWVLALRGTRAKRSKRYWRRYASKTSAQRRVSAASRRVT